MTVKIAQVRGEILVALYDLLQSSDEESHWYYLVDIRELISPEVSGAFAKIAVDDLIRGKLVEDGSDENYKDIFSLTGMGIAKAEELMEGKGGVARQAVPPSRDLIYSRDRDAEKIKELQRAIEELREQLKASNAAGHLNETDRGIIEAELSAAKEIADTNEFRPKRLSAFILPALRFLSDKFVGTALGEAAKHVIKLLLG